MNKLHKRRRKTARFFYEHGLHGRISGQEGKMKKVYSSGPLFLLLGCAIIVETACAGRGGPPIELRR